MATFESILRDVLPVYTVALAANDITARDQLMSEAFQAKNSRHSEYGSKYFLVGPGLCSRLGRKSSWVADATTYVDRLGTAAFPSQDNGLVELGMAYNESQVRKIFVSFYPGITLPPRGTKTQEAYTLEDEGRSLLIQFESGEGSYHLDREKGQQRRADFVAMKMSLREPTMVHKISFEPAILENGVLTHFFADIGYDGLDRLVK
ncbi:hypothetical protein HYV86_07005 [Candidatus Woesearchaeota archaeon]|nr:hypothetical protein [Candidatus Woesearchaeota archaeon]